MWLALTGGVSFLISAITAYAYNNWYLTFTSSCLALTSVWWHTSRLQIAFWVDQAAMAMFVINSGYVSISKGIIPSGLFFVTGTYCIVVYHLGRKWNLWAFDTNQTNYIFFHATLHIVPLLSVLSVFAFNNEVVPDLLFLPKDDCSDSIGSCLLEC